MTVEVMKPGWVGEEDHPIFSVDIHPAGTKFATGGQGNDCGRIIIWNLLPVVDPKAQADEKVPKQLCQMDNHLACVNCVRWSSDGKYLASAGDDKLVMLWSRSAYGGGAVFGGGGKVNIEAYKCAHTLRQHNGDVLDLAWSPGDRWLATCSVDNTVVIWQVGGEVVPSSLAVLRGHSGHVKGVTWDPVGKYIATQSADKSLRVWRTGDWKEEAQIKEPFEECGGTTHVLRLNWSPDGQYIVTAHAMNGGGPTAKIVERDGFRVDKDFVGHRKAVTCVRFSNNIYERPVNGKPAMYLYMAIGSRDRSVSVWSTSMKRPLFVCHDLFDSSILDLAWSKDGKVLLACSYDGNIAAINFSDMDLGHPLSFVEKDKLFKDLYGQTAGATISKPVLIENAALLRMSNGYAAPAPLDLLADLSNGTADMKLLANGSIPIKGPLDKQIEVKTSDGRRRITPMYIPPVVEANGEWSRHSFSSESGNRQLNSSSSTETKSKIKIERLDGVVEPNVSPGKKSPTATATPSSATATPSSATATPSSAVAPPLRLDRPNMIPIKRKVGLDSVPVIVSNSLPISGQKTAAEADKLTNGKTPTDRLPINGKPTPPVTNGKSADTCKSTMKPADASRPKEKDKEEEEIRMKKKPANRIVSSEESGSSSDSDGDSSDSDSSGSSSDDETASHTERSDKSDADKKAGGVSGAEGKSLKASLVGRKRKGEDITSAGSSAAAPPKKRGRPLGSTRTDSGLSTPVGKAVCNGSGPEPGSPAPAPAATAAAAPVAALAAPAATTVTAQPLLRAAPTSPIRAAPGLPPLAIPRNPHHLQLKTPAAIFSLRIENDFDRSAAGTLHRVSVHKGSNTSTSPLWRVVFSSPISGAVAGESLLMISCRDASFHTFQQDGSRALPPITLSSPPHRVYVERNLLVIVTTGGRLYLWDLTGGSPKVLLRNEEICPLNRHTSPRTSISITNISFPTSGTMPILSLTDGSSHAYSRDLGCWLQLSPPRVSLNLAGSSLARDLPASLPLASLTAKPTGVCKLDAEVSRTWTVSLVEAKLASCKYLSSPQEYRYWLLNLVKLLSAESEEARLRAILDGLLVEGRSQLPLGLERGQLLQEVLAQVASNLALQRLYSEYRGQVDMRQTKSGDLFQ